MKVFIGKYVKFWGPYQVAGLLKYLGVSKDKCHDIGKKLSETWVGKFLEKLHSKKSRKVDIEIHDYDVWDMDHTLALIIHPMLVKLKENKHGVALVDDEDVPEELRKPGGTGSKFDHSEDYELMQKRWEYVIDQMIWSFYEEANDNPSEQQYYQEKEPTNPDLEWKDFEEDGEKCSYLLPKFNIDYEGIKSYEARLSNGFRLFGKYYRTLWD